MWLSLPENGGEPGPPVVHQAMTNRLKGLMAEQIRSDAYALRLKLPQFSYAIAKLRELSVMWAFGGSAAWPRERIDKAIEAVKDQVADFLTPRRGGGGDRAPVDLHQPTPEHASELAQRAVDASRNVSRVELDYSPASLSLVDSVLEEFREPGSDAVVETIFRVRLLSRRGARPQRSLRMGRHAARSRPVHISAHHLSRGHRGTCEPNWEGLQACRQRRHRQRRLLLQRVRITQEFAGRRFTAAGIARVTGHMSWWAFVVARLMSEMNSFGLPRRYADYSTGSVVGVGWATVTSAGRRTNR